MGPRWEEAPPALAAPAALWLRSQAAVCSPVPILPPQDARARSDQRSFVRGRALTAWEASRQVPEAEGAWACQVPPSVGAQRPGKHRGPGSGRSCLPHPCPHLRSLLLQLCAWTTPTQCLSPSWVSRGKGATAGPHNLGSVERLGSWDPATAPRPRRGPGQCVLRLGLGGPFPQQGQRAESHRTDWSRAARHREGGCPLLLPLAALGLSPHLLWLPGQGLLDCTLPLTPLCLLSVDPDSEAPVPSDSGLFLLSNIKFCPEY